MTALQTLIVKNIWRFDPFSLLLLLQHHDYSMGDILFCSHYSNSSQSRLIESIEFRETPKKAVITLNMGLLGGQSVLPNYLFKQVDNERIDEERFAEFFGYFDDRLLRRFLHAIYPELDQYNTQNWEARKNATLYTLKIDTISTLHWLTQLVFPELQVRVENITFKRSMVLRPLILGKFDLSPQTIFGKRKILSVPGRRITLITDEESFTSGIPWTIEINQRLESLIYPILKNIGIDLELWLLIRNNTTALSLKQESYLGYENLHSDKLQTQRIRIFSGHLCD